MLFQQHDYFHGDSACSQMSLEIIILGLSSKIGAFFNIGSNESDPSLEASKLNRTSLLSHSEFYSAHISLFFSLSRPWHDSKRNLYCSLS